MQKRWKNREKKPVLSEGYGHICGHLDCFLIVRILNLEIIWHVVTTQNWFKNSWTNIHEDEEEIKSRIWEYITIENK